MPRSEKDVEAIQADWAPVVDVCFPRELYIRVLIEEAERELLKEAKKKTQELLGPNLTEH